MSERPWASSTVFRGQQSHLIADFSCLKTPSKSYSTKFSNPWVMKGKEVLPFEGTTFWVFCYAETNNQNIFSWRCFIANYPFSLTPIPLPIPKYVYTSIHLNNNHQKPERCSWTSMLYERDTLWLSKLLQYRQKLSCHWS